MDQEIVSLKDRTNFLINHGMKTGFKFKHIYDFSEEMEKIRKYIEKNGLEYNNKISKSRYSKTHGSVEQIKIISIENNKQIEKVLEAVKCMTNSFKVFGLYKKGKVVKG